MRADAQIVLGLAAGLLTLDNAVGLVDVEGDRAAVRAIFGARRAEPGRSARERRRQTPLTVADAALGGVLPNLQPDPVPHG